MGSTFSFTKSTCIRYDIRPKEGFGWGIFTIDENDGLFTCHSDCGDYNYSWPYHGRESFKHFLCEINTDYLLEKVSHRNYFNFHKSFESWKKTIIKLRKDRDCSREQARGAWDFIHHELEDCNSYDVCCERIANSDEINEIAGDEWWYLFEIEKDYSPDVYAFANKLWPMFISILKEEIGKSKQE